MKKNLNYLLSALGLSAAAIFTLSGCRDYDVMDEEVTKELLASKEYDQHFVDIFGEPMEGHMWGTDKVLEPITAFASKNTTRADYGSVLVNKNEWCYRQGGKYQKQGQFLHDIVKVPGWPNFDGYYYTSKGNGLFESKNVIGETTMLNDNSYQPIGDVTDYEIQYVSTWFRTHKDPQSISLHLTDFFIQNVSQDNDQLTYDHTISDPTKLDDYFMNGNLLDVSKTFNGENANRANDVLKPGTLDEKKDLSYVPKVTKTIGHENSNEELNYRLDNLKFIDMDGHTTHVNNFNRGNSNFSPEDLSGSIFREIKYITSSGTEGFECAASMGNKVNNKWVLVRLEWEEPAFDYETSHKTYTREGYYLAFDFATETYDTKIDYDGYYSNWIIKITPGYFVPSNYAARVMCEDLGGSFDFDYNDVVFDVANDNNSELIITIQAAGGTLPIVVGYGPTESNVAKYEIHHLLGNHASSQPINVDVSNPDVTSSVANYRIPLSSLSSLSSVSGKTDYYNIPIYVKQADGWKNVNTNLPTISEEEYGKPYTDPDKKTPRKFVTEIGVEWMKELQCIDNGYQKFKNWVTTGTMKYMLKDEKGEERELFWYNDITGAAQRHEIPKAIDGATQDPSKEIETWWDLKTIENTCPMNSYAIDVVSIATYPVSGTNSIIEKFRSKGDKQLITFASFLKSTNPTVKAFMVPVWVVNGKAVYRPKDDPTNPIEISETMLANLSAYKETYLQPHFTYYYDGSTLTEANSNYDTGIDGQGNYTSVCKTAFKRSEMAYMDGENEVFCDYLMIFVKENLDSYGKPLASPVVKQHELYCIF